MNTTLDCSPATLRATRVRYGVVGFCVALAMVTYLDRVCIATLAKDMRRDLGLDENMMALVFSAFSLAYTMFEIPTAWWGDRRGTRSVLTRIVLWWSTLTMATAASINYGMLLVMRFLFGAGEAGAWPCVAGTFSRWIPAKERGTVQGIFFAGAHLSGGLTPFLVVLLSNYFNWRTIFLMFGTVGFVWAAAWYWWYRDDPSEHRQVNPAELQTILAGRRPPSPHSASWAYWKRLFVHRNTLPLCLMYIGNVYPFYFCITWLPTYLEEHHHVTKTLLGLAAGLPLTLSVVADFFGGLTTDYLTKRFGLRIGRCALGAAGYALAAVFTFVSASTGNSVLAIISFSVAVALVMFTLGAAWGTCIEIGGSHTGVISATMNTVGQMSAIAGPVVTIFAKNHMGGWNAAIYVIAALFVVGAVCWWFIDPRDRVFD